MDSFSSGLRRQHTLQQQIKVDKMIDTRGIYCPGPLMELIRVMRRFAPGTVFEILSSDKISTKDIPDWTVKCGHEYLGVEKRRDYWRIFVKKIK